MNLGAHRTLIAIGVIGVSLCLGLSLGLIQPVRSSIAEMRGQIDAERRAIAEDESRRDTLPAMKMRLSRVQADLNAIKERSAIASSERDLYSAISTLAAKHNITLDHLTPERPREVAAPKAPASVPGFQPGAAVTPAKDVSVSYGMSVVATYPALIAFLADLEQNVGYAVVRAVRIDPTPVENTKTLNASIQVEFYAFDADVKVPDAPARAASIEDRT